MPSTSTPYRRQIEEEMEKIPLEFLPSPWFPEAVRMLADHPDLDTPELRAIHHIGYEAVAIDRQGVTGLWTDPGIREIIEALGIELIGYDDL